MTKINCLKKVFSFYRKPNKGKQGRSLTGQKKLQKRISTLKTEIVVFYLKHNNALKIVSMGCSHKATPDKKRTELQKKETKPRKKSAKTEVRSGRKVKFFSKTTFFGFLQRCGAARKVFV